MNPTIVVMKNGERLLTILEEVFGKQSEESEESSPIGLMLVNPFLLEMYEEDSEVKVRFTKWCPYSTDSKFRIPYDVVTCIAVPDPNLAAAYRTKVEALEQSQENLEDAETAEV
jgi:hypothetical protein